MTTRSFRLRRSQRAIAVAELAVCLPVLLILMFATIEATTMIYLRQKIKVGAYEGARVGITPKATATNVDYHSQTLLQSQNVKDFKVAMSPADPSVLESGDFFQVTISAPYAANSLLGGWIYANKTLSESVSLPVD